MRWFIALILIIIFLKQRRLIKFSNLKNEALNLLLLRAKFDSLLKKNCPNNQDLEACQKLENQINKIDNLLDILIDSQENYVEWLKIKNQAWEYFKNSVNIEEKDITPPWYSFNQASKKQTNQKVPEISSQEVIMQQIEITQEIKQETKQNNQENQDKQDNIIQYAWKHSKLNNLEQAMQKFSGWSKFFVPFITQNIGWLISGFFFITGSVFLISYTSGFIKALTISLILFGYTLILIFGAWYLIKKKPEARTAFIFLATIGMLIIPISIAASIKLFNISSSDGFKIIASFLMCCTNIFVFYWASVLSSGIIDRSLQKLHPKLFILLASIQISSPIISKISYWQILCVFHILILAILSYGFFKFINNWLKSIFLDKQKIAYYSAGTLFYAGLVSFVHITLSFKGFLPKGYYGPFIIAISGLLFYIDSYFKGYTKNYVFLSRFNFFVYGVSIISFICIFDCEVPRIITLCFGLFLYSFIFWKYLTLPPLYLLIACLSWLYWIFILRYFSFDKYFLLSLPVFFGLFKAYKFTQYRKAFKLNDITSKSFGILFISLNLFSLIFSKSGFIGLLTCIFLNLFLYNLKKLKHEFYEKYGEYLFCFSLVLTIGYLPKMAYIWAWHEMQFVTNLSLLALALNYFENFGQKNIKFLNSSFVMINISSFLALTWSISWAIAWSFDYLIISRKIFLAINFILASFILLNQSFQRKSQNIFYISLITIGLYGFIFKYLYLPGYSTGLFQIILFFIICQGLLFVEKKKLEDIKSIIFKPLTQAMFLILIISIYKSLSYPNYLVFTKLYLSNTCVLITSFCLEIIGCVVLIFIFRAFNFWFLPFLLGLIDIFYITNALYTSYYNFNVSYMALYKAIYIISSLYCLIVYGFILKFLNKDKLDKYLVKLKIHQVSYIIVNMAFGLSLYQMSLNFQASYLFVFCISLIFLVLTCKFYQKAFYAYNFFVILLANISGLYCWAFSINHVHNLLIDKYFSFVLIFLIFVLVKFKNFAPEFCQKPIRLVANFIFSITVLISSIYIIKALYFINYLDSNESLISLYLFLAQILVLIFLIKNYYKFAWFQSLLVLFLFTGLGISIGANLKIDINTPISNLCWASIICCLIIMGLKKFEALKFWFLGILFISLNTSKIFLPFYSLIFSLSYIILAHKNIFNRYLLNIAFIEWFLYLFYINNNLYLPSNIAYILAGILLIYLQIKKALRIQNGKLIYLIFFSFSLLIGFLRVFIFGFKAFELLDCVFILILSCLILVISRFSSVENFKKPLKNICLILPMLVLIKPNFAIFLITGLLYLLIYYNLRASFGLYFSMFFINLAIYFSISSLMSKINLLQFYAIPACISVLILLYLHKKELKKSVLNGSRLATISVLYACVSLDLFLNQNFFSFFWALILSLSGVLIGIAFRIRAFLYSGLAFIFINILSQILNFYPKESLSKGILLVLLGTIIMILMIWFNIKKEEILKKIRVFRADLESWD